LKRVILLLCVCCFITASQINGQFSVKGHFDLGDNNISNGVFLLLSNSGHYEALHWGADAGYQLGLAQPQDVVFNSWYLSSNGKIPVGKITLELGGEYLWTAFSPSLREVNWILFARTSLRHWQFGIGNNSRIYRLSSAASDNDPTVDPDNKIIEGWNLMYNIQYLIKPFNNNWNIMAAVTNYDQFLIEQETNPMINVRFEYGVTEPLLLYSELWYKSAGFLNGQVNYYEMFLRLGIQWKIGRNRI